MDLCLTFSARLRPAYITVAVLIRALGLGHVAVLLPLTRRVRSRQLRHCPASSDSTRSLPPDAANGATLLPTPFPHQDPQWTSGTFYRRLRLPNLSAKTSQKEFLHTNERDTVWPSQALR